MGAACSSTNDADIEHPAVKKLVAKIHEMASLGSKNKANKASDLVRKKANLKTQFTSLLDMRARIHKKEASEALDDINNLMNDQDEDDATILWDFLSLNGGIKATMKVYTETLKKMNLQVPTDDDLCWEEEDEGGEEAENDDTSRENDNTEEENDKTVDEDSNSGQEEHEDTGEDETEEEYSSEEEEQSDNEEEEEYVDEEQAIEWSDEEMEDSDYDDDSEDEEEWEIKTAKSLLRQLLSFWVRGTNLSATFALGMAETDLFEHLSKILKNEHKNSSELSQSSTTFFKTVNIFYNCARFPEMRRHLRSVNLVKLLLPFLECEGGVKALVLLTLSYITDEKENRQLVVGEDSDFEFLLELIDGAMKDSDHAQNGYTVLEVLQGLNSLAQSETNKNLLMNKGILEHVKPVLREGNEREKQEAATVIWQLALSKKSKTVRKLKHDKELMKQLNVLKKDKNNDVSKCATSALWVLNNMGSKGTKAEAVDGTDNKQDAGEIKGHIMISYQWDDKETLLKIRNELKKRKFKVWMDVDDMTGNLLDAMAEAVEQAAVVLVCASPRYKTSPNCKTEADYTFRRKKPFIPLLMQKNFSPDGWLGLMLGSKLYIDFSGKYPFNTKFEELITQLNKTGVTTD